MKQRLGLLTLSWVVSGCSFVAISSPPSNPSERTPEAAGRCQTDLYYPGMDLLGAAIGVANIGIAATVDEGDKVKWYGVEMSPGTGIALGVTQLALWGAGAVWGITQTSRCRELRREIAEQNPKWTPEEPAD